MLYEPIYKITYLAFSRSRNQVISINKGQRYTSERDAEKFLKEYFDAEKASYSHSAWHLNKGTLWRLEGEDNYDDFDWADAFIKEI